jgi:hypothetical protein
LLIIVVVSFKQGLKLGFINECEIFLEFFVVFIPEGLRDYLLAEVVLHWWDVLRRYTLGAERVPVEVLQPGLSLDLVHSVVTKAFVTLALNKFIDKFSCLR